jgi:hypothetical protein
MLKSMNGTFDPELMSKIPPAVPPPPFDLSQYMALLATFSLSLHSSESNALSNTLSRIFATLPAMSPRLSQRLREEVQQNFKEGTSIAKLDYFIISQPRHKKTIKLRQYLLAKKQLVTSNRIAYHGGYSQTLYTSWHSYVNHSKLTLPPKNFKLNSKLQKVNNWVQRFGELELVEVGLFGVLLYPLSIHQMKAVQQVRIGEGFTIFRELCVKGVLTIL